jgi:phosphatidylserine synthase
LPVPAVFAIFSVLIFFGRQILREWNTDPWVLASGNDILFGLTAISYFLHIKSIRTPNPHVFVRAVYGSLIIKMMVCMVAALLYGWLAKSVNKGAIFGCFILYVVYTFLEVRILLKFIKKLPNNA